MGKSKKLDWQSWLYGLFAGIIGGAATSIVTIAGGQVVGAANFTPRQIVTVGVISALVNGAMFLKQSPLPKVIEVDERTSVASRATGSYGRSRRSSPRPQKGS